MPRDREAILLKTTNVRTLKGLIKLSISRLWTMVASVMVPMAISVKPKKRMLFLVSMFVKKNVKMVELEGFEPSTPCVPRKCSPS